ncbi:MAG: choice-of-anchor W domain-containing protein [Planctomycetota bacterium]|jgi:hypothetical protein
MKRTWVVCIAIVLTAIFVTTTQARVSPLDDFEGGSKAKWFHRHNPGDGRREGGFGQDPPDTTDDSKTPLQIVTDPDDPNNKSLAWKFDGRFPNGVTEEGFSYFDLFLDMPEPEDWSRILGIKFDIKVKSTGKMSWNDYARIYARMDNDATRPILDPNLFDDDSRVWQANNLDVLKNCGGWSRFILNLDRIFKGNSYFSPGHYNIEHPFDNSIIKRKWLESFRFFLSLRNNLWLGSEEVMTVYFDNLNFVEFGPPLDTSMSNVTVSEDSYGPFLIYKDMVETRIGNSPGAYGDWEIGLRTEESGFAPVALNNNYIWSNASDPNAWLFGEPNSPFVLSFTKETGNVEFDLGYSPTLSHDYDKYAGVGMDKVYLMAKSDNKDRVCSISDLKVNGVSPDNVSELVGSDGQTYATISGIGYEDFIITGMISFGYEEEADHSEIEALIAFGMPGPAPEGPNDIWTLVDKTSIVEEGPQENPYVIKLESIGDEAPPWGSVLFTPPESMTFNDMNELSADFEMTEGTFGGGSPRFSILIDWNDSHVIDEGDKYAFIYWGTTPNYMDEPVHNGWYVDEQDPNWAERNNTGNLVDTADHRVDLSQFGGPFYSTIEEAKELFGNKDVLEIILVLDGSWLGDQVLLVDNIKVQTYTDDYTTYLYDAYSVIPEVDIVCDINGDNQVTVADLCIIAANWLRDDCTGENCGNADIAPLVRDGKVDNIDFVALYDCWLDGVEFDLTPPEPNVMTWASEPNAIPEMNSITMTATTATDSSGVEYYFKNVTLPTHNSLWQQSTVYLDSELDSGTEYTYQVKARDMSPNQNETQYSAPASAIALGEDAEVEITDTFTSMPPHDARLADNGAGTGIFYDRDDSDAKALRIGDYYTNQAYRTLLAFDTSSIPTDATILSASLQLTCGIAEGTSPDNWPGGGARCLVDIASPYFGTTDNVEAADWQNEADEVGIAEFMEYPIPGETIVSTGFNAAGLGLINKYGSTQFRVYLTPSAWTNSIQDYLGFYSGEQEGREGQAERRPLLRVTYTTKTPTMAISGIDPFPVGLGEWDGRVWDDGAGTGEGGNSTDSNKEALRLGDYATGESYRTLITFDTSVFPENYSIENVMLKLARGASVGTNPFNWGGTCNIDLAAPHFHNSLEMEPEDWGAPATATAVATFLSAPTDPNEGDYMISGKFNAEGRMNINLDGLTQFRVYFTVPRNSSGTDYLGFWSAEAVETRKPKLLIEYTID